MKLCLKRTSDILVYDNDNETIEHGNFLLLKLKWTDSTETWKVKVKRVVEINCGIINKLSSFDRTLKSHKLKQMTNNWISIGEKTVINLGHKLIGTIFKMALNVDP